MGTDDVNMKPAGNFGSGLGVSESTLARWHKAGLIRTCSLPKGTRRFRPAEISRMNKEMFGGAVAARLFQQSANEAETADPLD